MIKHTKKKLYRAKARSQFSFKKCMFLFRLTALLQNLKNVIWTKFNFAAVTKDNNVSTFQQNKLNETHLTNICHRSGPTGRTIQE